MIPVDGAALLELARDVAREAGDALLARLGDPGLVGSKSSPTDTVTEADRASEAYIKRRLLTARPSDGILGEEGSDITGTSGVRWIVDPLDGTVNFLYRHPGAWSVSIAAADEAGLAVGVVYDPARGELFAARRGVPALLNGMPLTVSGETELARALCGTGFGYLPAVRAVQGQMLASVLPQIRDIRRNGSAALDLCWVAAGRLDAYFEYGVHPWDYSAGALIVAAAGGAWQLRPDGILVAANRSLLAALDGLLPPFGPLAA